jgi:replication factor C large subunit
MQDEWTEKYRPKSLAQITGNESAVQAMRRWAESWHSGKPRRKALVLRGDPGTGKTSAALALANDMDWDLVEMNASDHRNAESIRKIAGMGAVSQTFSLTGEFLSSNKGRRKLIVLDEADNLFGREDRGGAGAIVETIRESGQPIILIVNDYRELTRKAPAIKTLAEKADFGRLSPRSVISVLRSVADKESVQVGEDVLSKIAENCGGDMRAAINDLQMMVEGKDVLTLDDSSAMGKRNQLKELNSALNLMFGAKTLRDARDATLDMDMTPDELEKWIDEGIPHEMRDPSDQARAFDALSRSDVYLGRTRILQHYGLWSYAKEMMTAGVSLSRKRGQRSPVYDYGFPSHFIMLSRAKGPRAARNSVSGKLARHLHTSRRRVNESTLPLLSQTVRNDRELLLRLISDAELDDGDVAFLLGTEPDSQEVKCAMAEAAGTGAEKRDSQIEGPRGRRPTGKKDSLRGF